MSIVALSSYLLQATLFEYIEIFGVKPNLIIVTTIAYALIRGKEEGAIYGLFSGLLLDIMAGKIIGMYAILGLYLGLIIGILHKNLNNENYLNTILLTGAGTFFYNIFHYILNLSVDTSKQFFVYIMSIILPEVVYNSIFSVFVYFIVIYINKKLDYKNRSVRLYKL